MLGPKVPVMVGEDVFPASERVQGQAESRAAHQVFLERLKEFTWWQDYQAIQAMGWNNWRVAVFIAWSASPGYDRMPATQRELAVEVLGLKDDRTIRKWREKHPEIEETIAAVQAAPLLRYRRDVFEALAESAANADANRSADRKLFLQLTGDLKPASQLEVSGPEGGPLEQVIVYIPENGRDDGDSPAGGATD